jgi:hypothetical protein
LEGRMRHIRTTERRAAFKVLEATASAQAAVMILQPAQSTGEPQNEHPHSEQWPIHTKQAPYLTYAIGGLVPAVPSPKGYIGISHTGQVEVGDPR